MDNEINRVMDDEDDIDHPTLNVNQISARARDILRNNNRLNRSVVTRQVGAHIANAHNIVANRGASSRSSRVVENSNSGNRGQGSKARRRSTRRNAVN